MVGGKFGAAIFGMNGGCLAVNDATMDGVLHVRGGVGFAEEPFVVGFVVSEVERDCGVLDGEAPFPEGVLATAGPAGASGDEPRFEFAALMRAAPRPRVAIPPRR